MYFQQFYLGCLAHASYLIGADGEAAVVDPQRDVEQYLQAAAAHGFQIKYVIETHLHADFVSGHRELAARTGADIVFGHQAGATFSHRAVHDGDEITLGTVTLRFLETPGHTPESIAVLVIDRTVSDQAQKVLTGDTLFIGDVGRPDLVGAKGYTAAQMAGMLYDSLHAKLLTLDDRVEVYPAHGAGSMCGRNIGQETSSTIGEQKRFNYALRVLKVEGAYALEGYSNYSMTGKQLPRLRIAGDRGVTHIHHRVLDIGVPQSILHEGDIRASVQQMDRNGVPAMPRSA